jgi:hypothetical protein
LTHDDPKLDRLAHAVTGVVLFVAGIVAGIWLWNTKDACAALTVIIFLWLGSAYCWIMR